MVARIDGAGAGKAKGQTPAQKQAAKNAAAQQAISKQAVAKQSAANNAAAARGIPANKAYGGSPNAPTRPSGLAKVAAATASMPQNSAPAIDWNSIANAVIEGPASAPAPPPPVYEAPLSYQAPQVIQPPAVVDQAESIANAPTGEKFQSFGSLPGTFGAFERMRNSRSPKSGLSMTPEMLRRAAAARLG